MRVIFLFLIVFIFGCKGERLSDHSIGKMEEKTLVSNDKTIFDYALDTQDYFWEAKHLENSNYWVRLVFQKEFVVYQFNGQCLYWFFTKHYSNENKTIELIWSYKNDCLEQLDFLYRSNGVEHYPKFGDKFCEYKLLKDSIVKVDYYFPEWVYKINEIEKDSIFPNYLYLN